MGIHVEQDSDGNWPFRSSEGVEKTLRADLLGNWQVPMKEGLIGDWRAELAGVDLLYYLGGQGHALRRDDQWH
jgi:hypothetical protein